MGLGKTLQVVTYISGLFRGKHARRVLVVVPLSLLHHWHAEFQKWVPEVCVEMVCAGKNPQRVIDRVILSSAHTLAPTHSHTHAGGESVRASEKEGERVSGCVLITTYGIVASKTDLFLQHNCVWDCVVLDEGHRIKNKNMKLRHTLTRLTHSTRAHRQPHTHSRAYTHTLAITGTPVQNNLSELWSLYDFVCHGTLLGPYSLFMHNFAGPIQRAGERDADEEEKILGEEMTRRLRKLIAPHTLRRTKTQVFACARVEAPEDGSSEASQTEQTRLQFQVEKRDVIVWLSLTQTQRKMYTSFLSELNVKAALEHPFSVLSTLRCICNQPRLCFPAAASPAQLARFGVAPPLSAASARRDSVPMQDDDDVDDDQVRGDDTGEDGHVMFDTFADMQDAFSSRDDVAQDGGEPPVRTKHGIPLCLAPYTRDLLLTAANAQDADSIISQSAKFQFLFQLLPRLRESGDRVLIFSQSTRMLDLLEICLRSYRFSFLRIDGSTKAGDRQERVNVFNTTPSCFCFLLTTQVGGVGLNLNGANRVIIMDPSWNPSADNQAVDRCYRIGQTRDVIVYRLIPCGTLQEKVYRKQISKDRLMRSTITSSNDDSLGTQYRYFTKQDLRDLFSIGNFDDSETLEQLQQVHGRDVLPQAKGIAAFGAAFEFLSSCTTRTETTGVVAFSDNGVLWTKEEKSVTQADIDKIKEKLTKRAEATPRRATKPPNNAKEKKTPRRTTSAFFRRLEDWLTDNATSSAHSPSQSTPQTQDSTPDPPPAAAESQWEDIRVPVPPEPKRRSSLLPARRSSLPPVRRASIVDTPPRPRTQRRRVIDGSPGPAVPVETQLEATVEPTTSTLCCQQHRQQAQPAIALTCRCALSPGELQMYLATLESARECEVRGEVQKELEYLLDALEICSDEPAVHQRAQALGAALGFA
eukprot:TRINITY_DN7271_c0_g1_i1.p1 TRINITY_DN7271_c0_g1~~TRINITY_DN7271_c0_g1_i1.p1  ORF type:complete len:1067 (+),score=232.72 TRINITY_DN7271_c0_g1_i1:435-3203(+)